MANMKLFLAVALCLAVSASAQSLDASKYICPTGWVPIVENYQSTMVTCAPDPCVGACGTGNTCTSAISGVSGRNFLTNTCKCNAPSVLSHIVNHDFCFVQGTSVCNPNPCKAGTTCQVLQDFNGQPGAHQCVVPGNTFASCPTGYFGLNCDITGPEPRALPKDTPVGSCDPNPCGVGGSCQPIISYQGTYTCTCFPGFFIASNPATGGTLCAPNLVNPYTTY